MYKCTAVSPTPPATCETYAGYASTFCTVRSCLPNGRGKLDKKEEKNRMQRHHWVTKRRWRREHEPRPKTKKGKGHRNRGKQQASVQRASLLLRRSTPRACTEPVLDAMERSSNLTRTHKSRMQRHHWASTRSG